MGVMLPWCRYPEPASARQQLWAGAAGGGALRAGEEEKEKEEEVKDGRRSGAAGALGNGACWGTSGREGRGFALRCGLQLPEISVFLG